MSDAAGNVLTMQDYQDPGQTQRDQTVYTYTNEHQISTVIAPGGKLWDYDYNALGQITQVSLPNGTTSAYEYDSLNRMTKIAHKDGATVLDSYQYTLDNVNNIAAITQSDGSKWSYAYDGRYRLTRATRDNAATAPTVSAVYQYTYDAGDNLLTKVEPLNDDFNDGDYADWTAGAGWDASGHCMSKTSTSWASFCRSTTDADMDLWFSYRLDDTSTSDVALQAFPRLVDGNNQIAVRFTRSTGYIAQVLNGVTTNLAVATCQATQGKWYDVYVKCVGANVTVYRAERGAGTEMTPVLATTSAQVLTSVKLNFWMGLAGALDNIRAVADGLTSTTTYAYDKINELTCVTRDGVDTLYTYDARGRTTSKSMQSGAHTTTYTYKYGDKLKRIDSTFPDEPTLVQYMYDGLGKRRMRVVDNTDTRWYRWDAGWNVVAEYADPDTDWTPENRALSYVPGADAEISGTQASTGAYRYYYTDHLGSIRHMRDQAKASLATYEYDPYGGPYTTSGLALNHGYTGHTWDAASGLYYAPYRYYSPGNARWMTRDPLGMVDGPNLYGYVRGNPARYRDPLGQSICGLCDIIIDILFPPRESPKEPQGPQKPEPPAPETPGRNQIDNAVSTVADAIVEIITDGTPGLPPGFKEAADAAGTASDVAKIAINQTFKDRSASSLADDPLSGDIPHCSGGGVSRER